MELRLTDQNGDASTIASAITVATEVEELVIKTATVIDGVHQAVVDLLKKDNKLTTLTVFSEETLSEDGAGLAEELLRGLKDSPALKRIVFQNYFSCTQCVVAIGLALQSGSSIESVDLGAALNRSSLPGFSRVLSTSTVLKRLKLSTVDDEDGRSAWVLRTLMENKTLEALTLYDVPMNDTHFVDFAHLITTNSTLRELRVSSFKLNDMPAARAFSLALAHNTTLRGLGLSLDITDPDVCAMVAAGVSANTRLRDLSMVFKGAKNPAGAITAIMNNRSLVTLKLGFDSMKTSEAVAVACGIRTNRSLRALKIVRAWVYFDKFQHMYEALEVNQHIEAFEVDDICAGWKASVLVLTKRNAHRRRMRLFRGVARAIWLLKAAHSATLRPGGPGFKRAKVSFEESAAAQVAAKPRGALVIRGT